MYFLLFFFLQINFCLFLNIVRVLFTKLNAPHNRESRNARYRRLAKSTLILIPLFGCHIIFSFKPEHLSVKAELILLTFEMLLSSFQGFVVAILLCFANCEVKSEIASFWERNFVGDNSHRPTPFTSLSEYFARSRQSFSEQKMTSVIDNNLEAVIIVAPIIYIHINQSMSVYNLSIYLSIYLSLRWTRFLPAK
ncbi:unnamed protein product [Acanthosepion pharaonis]|uniref:G-protein coupled receptors family 2 profile 2 domain-containing protein n=1 Tax=Acanthosepion pharaonis TaxID=158019 RepID=A0A812B2S8_ACAPH|nr:unnamed protein product [Sepia pharaonis]